MSRERSPEELGEDLDEIKATLADLRSELRQGFVPRELYDARHLGLRSEVALEMAAIKAQQDADRLAAEKANLASQTKAEGARVLSMWALGLICSAVIVALVGFLVAGAGGAA